MATEKPLSPFDRLMAADRQRRLADSRADTSRWVAAEFARDLLKAIDAAEIHLGIAQADADCLRRALERVEEADQVVAQAKDAFDLAAKDLGLERKGGGA